MIDEMLEKIAVRVESTTGSAIGSGVIWVPQIESEYVYVFTVAHVVTQQEVVVRCLYGSCEEGKVLIYSSESDLKCHPHYKNADDVIENDVAIIRVKKEEWMRELPILVLGQPYRKTMVYGRGFPDNARDRLFSLSGQDLKGTVGNFSKLEKRFQITLDMSINPTDRSSELSGYSGTGIFDQNIFQDELVLLGMFSFGQGVDSAQGITNVFSVELIRDICQYNNWDIPENFTEAPLSFEPFIQAAIGKFTTHAIKDEFHENAMEIISKITPSNLLEKIDDCHDIPKCNSNKMRCREHWIAILQFLSIIGIWGEGNTNLHNVSIPFEHDGRDINLPIEFVCSEGHDGNGTINTLVRSLIMCEYSKGKRLRDNGIVIWASNEVPTKKICKKSKYCNVVKNICHESKGEARRMQLDIKFGEQPPANLSIIHIHKLLEDLDDMDEENCTRADMKQCVKELFINAIS